MSDRVEPNTRRICVAMLNGAHGIRGDVRIRPYTEDPHLLERFDAVYLGDGTDTVTVRLLHALRGGWAARITGVATREDAERLRGSELFVTRDALEDMSPPDDPDSFFLIDLVGLAAVTPTGDSLGTVVAVPDFGAGDLLELTLDQAVPAYGKSVLLPFKQRYVPDINLETGQMTVDLDAWLEQQSDGAKGGTTDEDGAS